ncbi:integral membrane sensor signal transduction histidine kinase [Pseudopedobacter saltans DSM 12145]|uniref:histidine kinase n=1 Tax=Pseudopedobacter saltans (strain ATCC 51119 / DSM 12145 / JCM 21818 / CCUG 39354 / LMG 10337 / NBRC 100064 / NCIMB 13643) TaxID=762903 RepID=F0S6R7_PSESL|nr:HAMP domain-containing sensor histidine kinase [Pseudopedobacter saltans]ADY52177.1 integral membrane sensor signal transduction histidine kinase [Pseudopedobacter saltans DSM 12145]
MSIRKKILIYFSAVTVMLVAIALMVIYILFSEYREEDFQQRQKEKIHLTLKFLAEIKRADKDIVEYLDRNSINEMLDEKLLIFDNSKSLIYTSVDNTKIPYSRDLLNKLSESQPWIETKDGLYDVVSIYLRKNDLAYYGISKAYDVYGYTKLNFLKSVLIATFFLVSFIVILVSFYLSKKITKPVKSITDKIKNFDFDQEFQPLVFHEAENEMSILANQFNLLVKRLKEAFSFQKNAINHISHELKTPISILVSNFDRIEREQDPILKQELIVGQKESTKNLSEIINLLLEISKTEANRTLNLSEFRIDELIFDVLDEIELIHPEFKLHVEYAELDNEENLMIKANYNLMRLVFINLFQNAVYYSPDKKAQLKITPKDGKVIISLENMGETIEKGEQPFLFQHFFRGKNSSGKSGFGLGLVFIHKILTLHHGTIQYQSTRQNRNKFIIVLPLS